MYIISKFKDYYDIGLSEGHDMSIVYKRFVEEETFQVSRFRPKNAKPILFEKETTGLRESLDIKYKWIVVGFCGKVFQCLELTKEIETKHTRYKLSPAEIHTAYCYEPLAAKKFFEKWASKEQLKTFYSKPKHMREGLRFSKIQQRFFHWDNDRFDQVFIKLNSPIFVVDRVESKFRHDLIRIRSNIELREYQFFQLFCPYTTFQEISMFISGVLGMPAPSMFEIDDKCMRDAKGFNDQSFKTRPNTKPNRKRGR